MGPGGYPKSLARDPKGSEHSGRKDVSEQVPGERVRPQTSFLEQRAWQPPAALTKLLPPVRQDTNPPGQTQLPRLRHPSPSTRCTQPFRPTPVGLLLSLSHTHTSHSHMNSHSHACTHVLTDTHTFTHAYTRAQIHTIICAHTQHTQWQPH